MRTRVLAITLGLALATGIPLSAAEIPPSITTPDKVTSTIGTLEYRDGAPSKETVAKAYDYLLVPPGYKGEMPASGYFVHKLHTTRATALGRSFLENNDPKPAVALIKETLKVYPYVSGGYGTSNLKQGKEPSHEPV